jgi:hypothetical protein
MSEGHPFSFVILDLEFGICLGFGIWDLEFPDKPGPFWFRLGWLVFFVLLW